MNDTALDSSSSVQNISSNLYGYDYSTYILGALLLISEVLPLLKSKSNGLAHACLCLIKGSKCMLAKIEDNLETKIQNPPPIV